MHYNSHCSTRSDGSAPKSERATSQPPIQRRNSLARAIALTLAVGSALPAWALDETPPNEQKQTAATTTIAGSPQSETQVGDFAANNSIYRDPITGKFGPPPPVGMEGVSPLDLSVIQQNLSTSPDGLKEQSAPGGGRMVKLNGRFQDTLIVTMDADGKVVTPSTSSSVTPIEEKE